MKYFHLKHRVQEAALLAGFLLCSTPMMAQSGIDSLDNGGSLGGDTGTEGTGIEQVVTDPSADSPAARTNPEYYTLSGQRAYSPRRGDIYIIRWREQGKWRMEKVVGRF